MPFEDKFQGETDDARESDEEIWSASSDQISDFKIIKTLLYWK